MFGLHIGIALLLGLSAWIIADFFTGAVTAALIFAAASCARAAFRDH